ncbi:hypothetical protein [Pseudoxanthomonas kaohsiungensis]
MCARPIRPTPTVPAVVQELPMLSEIAAQTRNATGRNQAGSISWMP